MDRALFIQFLLNDKYIIIAHASTLVSSIDPTTIFYVIYTVKNIDKNFVISFANTATR